MTMTIDELARQTGHTTRNIRAYQSSGLLHAPRKQGRAAYYDEGHLQRLLTIRRLRDCGIGLDAVRGVLERTSLDAPAAALAQAFSEHLNATESPSVLEPDVFTRRWGDQATPAAVERILKLGIFRELADGRFEVVVPAIERGGERLAQLGVPLSASVDIQENLLHHLNAAADGFIAIFLQYIAPKITSESGEWSEVASAVDELIPLTTEGVAGAFRMVFKDKLNAALLQSLRKSSK